jgi:hypothetical protein
VFGCYTKWKSEMKDGDGRDRREKWNQKREKEEL